MPFAARHGICRPDHRLRVILLATALVATQACADRNRPVPAPRSPRSVPRSVVRPARYEVTAYCRGRTTSAGAPVREGMVAADSSLLPIGTVVRITGLPGGYDGTFRVMDTGPAIRGRRLDLYIADCRTAIQFGRRTATVSIVRSAP
jgi:3D (Asp-Asp-Asp) domain-containing protein